MTVLKHWKTRILLILAVVGPGFITANVDNDAGGIYTYSFAGAQFGYTLLWTIIPMTLALIVVQAMGARMGAVTGKGLSDLIREEYGLRHSRSDDWPQRYAGFLLIRFRCHPRVMGSGWPDEVI
jgi:Mn2+/Fe2+ NRAMP family transporter